MRWRFGRSGKSKRGSERAWSFCFLALAPAAALLLCLGVPLLRFKCCVSSAFVGS